MTARAADLFEKDLLWAWMDNAKMGLCVLDQDGRVVIVNRVITVQFAVRAAELIGRDASILLTRSEAAPELITWIKSDEDGPPRDLSFKRDGHTLHLSINASNLTYHDGERYRVLAVSDVTQLRTAQMELEASMRRWEAINAGVVISDARATDMPITYVNSMFEQMSGYAAAEVLGRNCRFLQGTDTDQPGLAPLRDAIRNQTNGYALLRNYRKDGSVFSNELFIAPIRDASGTVTHFIGVQHESGSRDTHPVSIQDARPA
jgi:PAS domain S-box-containing protein